MQQFYIPLDQTKFGGTVGKASLRIGGSLQLENVGEEESRTGSRQNAAFPTAGQP